MENNLWTNQRKRGVLSRKCQILYLCSRRYIKEKTESQATLDKTFIKLFSYFSLVIIKLQALILTWSWQSVSSPDILDPGDGDQSLTAWPGTPWWPVSDSGGLQTLLTCQHWESWIWAALVVVQILQVPELVHGLAEEVVQAESHDSSASAGEMTEDDHDHN